MSAGVVVPVFALAAAGISLAAAGAALGDPTARGAAVAPLVGKRVGIVPGSWPAVRSRLGALPPEVGSADVVPVAMLGGVGYTVSLLIVRLSVPGAGSDTAAAAALGPR